MYFHREKVSHERNDLGFVNKSKMISRFDYTTGCSETGKKLNRITNLIAQRNTDERDRHVNPSTSTDDLPFIVMLLLNLCATSNMSQEMSE